MLPRLQFDLVKNLVASCSVPPLQLIPLFVFVPPSSVFNLDTVPSPLGFVTGVIVTPCLHFIIPSQLYEHLLVLVLYMVDFALNLLKLPLQILDSLLFMAEFLWALVGRDWLRGISLATGTESVVSK